VTKMGLQVTKMGVTSDKNGSASDRNLTEASLIVNYNLLSLRIQGGLSNGM
jgi:hypothetical protein